MRFLNDIQRAIEDTYGAATGLDVRDFVVPRADFKPLGSLLVAQLAQDDLDVALLFDRDVLAAFEGSAPKAVAVSIEEVSHFVYLSYNHARGRNVTALEMEMQSEVDRILLAFHGTLDIDANVRAHLLTELYEHRYPDERYEAGRRAAARLVRGLSGGDPRAWTAREFELLRRFFHSDLSEKLSLAERK